MANATYKGSQASRPIHASDCCGNAWIDSNAVSVPAVILATTDTIVVLTVPAGTRLNTLRFRNGDLDSGVATLTMNIGYRSKHATPQLAANATYFAAGNTSFQAPVTAAWTEIIFNDITFNEPVDIVLVPAVAGTGAPAAAAVLYCQATGAVVGPL